MQAHHATHASVHTLAYGYTLLAIIQSILQDWEDAAELCVPFIH